MCQYANVPIAMQYAAAAANWHIGTIGILARYSAYYSKLFFCHVKSLVM